MSGTVEITTYEQFKDVISPQSNTVVYFYAHWCQHCQAMSPMIERAASTNEVDTIRYYKINTDVQKKSKEESKVTNIPEIIVFRAGKELARSHELMGLRGFEEWLLQTITNSVTNPPGSLLPGSSPNQRREDKSESIQLDHPDVSENQSVCTGQYTTKKRHRYLNWLPNRKLFPDPEPNCVFKPVSEDDGLRIGRANEGSSYLSITLWNSFHQDPEKIFFGIDFMPDPTKNARFESAIFSVTFSHHATGGNYLPLTIRELFPADGEDRIPRVRVEDEADVSRDNEDNTSTISSIDHASLISSINETRPDGTLKYTRTQIKGHGIRSSTATWSFIEDESQEVRRGLDAHYNAFVSLPTINKVGLTFWAKAVLVYGDGSGVGGRVTLKLGSMETPYERILDLSSVDTRAN